MLAVASLGLAIATSLAYRYFATDGVLYHIRALRLYETNDKVVSDDVRENMSARNEQYKISAALLFVSWLLLVLGTLSVCWAFGGVLWMPATK